MRLKMPSSRFTKLRYFMVARAPAPGSSTGRARESTAAMAKLVSGPTMAMTNSAPGRSGSRSICDTPPKMCRVMLDTGMP